MLSVAAHVCGSQQQHQYQVGRDPWEAQQRTGGAQEQSAVGTAVLLGVLHTNGVQTLAGGRVRLVDRKQALAGRRQGFLQSSMQLQ